MIDSLQIARSSGASGSNSQRNERSMVRVNGVSRRLERSIPSRSKSDGTVAIETLCSSNDGVLSLGIPIRCIAIEASKPNSKATERSHSLNWKDIASIFTSLVTQVDWLDKQTTSPSLFLITWRQSYTSVPAKERFISSDP